VRWMIKNEECKHLNTTDYVPLRLRHTLKVSKTGLRLVMFQVWFMKNAATGTLKGYNERLGRPQSKVRSEIFAKSKFILSSDKWSDYFNELDIVLGGDKDLDQLLRFSIYRSKKMGYHGYANPARHARGGYQNGHYGNNPHPKPQQYGYGRGYGGGMQQQHQQQMRSNLRIYAMRPPAMSVKGAPQSTKPLPPPAKKTMSRPNRPVQHKNVNKARNGSNHSTKKPQQPRREKAKSTTKSMRPAKSPKKQNETAPVSSLPSRNAGKDEAKLSKAQRARLRKRMAKERKKEAQKFYKRTCSVLR